jgi:hypothetical protein
MSNLSTTGDSSDGIGLARPGETLRIRSGLRVFSADDPSSVGSVESSSRDDAGNQHLLVSTGWWHRVVRRVPPESVGSADDRRVQLRVSRLEFLSLPPCLSDHEVVGSVWDSFRDFRPFLYRDTTSITVTSHNGAVTLSGHVSHEGHRRQAVRCAHKADGVISLSDRLTSDELLIASVARSFMSYPGLQPSRVRVSARLGTVTLEGRLASQELIGLASSTTLGVPGVKALENRIRLGTPGEAAGREI